MAIVAARSDTSRYTLTDEQVVPRREEDPIGPLELQDEDNVEGMPLCMGNQSQARILNKQGSSHEWGRYNDADEIYLR